jgi:type II secretory pathway component PulK
VAKERPPILNRSERGASLILVLVALAALTPLALILSDLVLMRQRQVGGHQHSVGGQALVRGGLDLAMTRLQSRQIALGSAQSAEFDLEEGPRAVRVRVFREPDAVLALDGSVIDPADAADLDLDRLAIDPTSGAVREYRRLEVYAVDAEAPARYPFAAVRLLAVVGRLDEGVICLGVRYDRGYFP